MSEKENDPPYGELTHAVVALISDIRKERDRALKEVIPLRRALRDLIVSADRVLYWDEARLR